MSQVEIIDAAKKLIGKHDEDDYKIKPSTFSSDFTANAPELASVLDGSAISTAAEEYELKDDEANDAQKTYKKWTNRANWSVFLTATFSAGLAATGAWSALIGLEESAQQIGIGFLTTGGIIFGGFAGMSINRIRSGKLLKKWMQQRAEAEMQRLQYFELATHQQEQNVPNNKMPLELLQFELFRRYQLEVQHTYYKNRGTDHDKAATKALSTSAWIMGGVAIANGLAGAFGIVNPQWTIIAAAALIAQSFATRITTTEAVNQDSRNAERYERTRSTLNELSGKSDDVRKGILSGDKEVLPRFVEAVHEQMSVEHRQWIDSFEDRNSAVARLEEKLDQLKPPQAEEGTN